MATEKNESKAPAEEVAAVPDLTHYDSLAKNQNEGVVVDIVDPAGKSLGFSIRVAGPDSERQKKAMEKLRDERLQSDDIKPLDSEQIAQRQVRALAMSVISWTKFKLDDTVLSYNEANAVHLFNRFPFIKDQVEARAGSRAAFLKLSKQDASALSGGGSKG